MTLFVMTALPDFFNRYGFHLVPGFWAQCYPLTFFFIGSYIHEYRPRIKVWMEVVIILLCCLVNPVFNILFVKHHSLIQIAGDGVKDVFGTLNAVLFFLMCYQCDVKRQWEKNVLAKISYLSLDMYLVSFIFDKLFYPYFMKNYYVNAERFGLFFFIIVPLVFVCSFILSWFTDPIIKAIKKVIV